MSVLGALLVVVNERAGWKDRASLAAGGGGEDARRRVVSERTGDVGGIGLRLLLLKSADIEIGLRLLMLRVRAGDVADYRASAVGDIWLRW